MWYRRKKDNRIMLEETAKETANAKKKVRTVKKIQKKSTKQKESLSKNLKLGLVLSGGGAHGAYQAGIVKALYESGYRFKIISGTSIGALNGYLAAAGEIRELERAWMQMQRMQLLNAGTFSKLIFSRGNSLLEDDLQQSILIQHVKASKLKKTKVELITSAVCIQDGQLHYFSSKDAKTKQEQIKRILASAAIPGIFPPIMINRRQFIDGGLLTNTPIEPLMKKKLDHIVVISMEPEKFEPGNMDSIGQVALRSMSIFFKSQAQIFIDYWKREREYHRKVQASAESINHMIEKSNLQKSAPQLVKQLRSYLQLTGGKTNLPVLHVVRPHKRLILEQLDFDGRKIPYVFEQGYLDGIKFSKSFSRKISTGK